VIPFTKIGTGLWSWSPWLRLETGSDDIVGRCARLLWLAIYTSPESKRSVPGLLNVSVGGLAELAAMPTQAAYSYFDRLLAHDLVEYDAERRVVRLTSLPDGCEAPTNGNTIRAWWRRFLSVPECEIRDAHVGTVHWMLERWSLEAGRPISADHSKAWAETFGTISIPKQVRRGVRSLLGDSDTSTPVQPSLFQKPPIPSVKGSLVASGARSETQSADSAGHDTPQRASHDLDPKTVINDPDPGRVPGRVPGTLLEPTGSGYGSGYGSGSQISESRSGARAPEIVYLTVLDGGFDVHELWLMLQEARPGYPAAFTEKQYTALQRAIDAISTKFRTPHAIACLREYIASGMEGFPRPPLTAEQRSSPEGDLAPEIIAAPGWLPRAIEHAVAWKARVDEKSAMLREARMQLGHLPKDDAT
jgi:hypothetical protein